MLWDQITAIFENTPGIDQLQNKKGVKQGKYDSLKEVFGEAFTWTWFLPINLPQKCKFALCVILPYAWLVTAMMYYGCICLRSFI